ncbi:hypothetical protein [Clostridium sp. HBUAS56010]|uniref:hypothetical protein n=1 Tax=Clostridium sp. HBUAS56010 TaxID=2571127 RepID=UPI001178C625|nr:hypothetical protein [Clostridium sp. HBUAS56010]
MNNAWVKPIISIKDVENLKKALKVGDRLIYRSMIKEETDERIVIPKSEKVVVVRKYPHLVQVENPQRPGKGIKTMTYTEILFQRREIPWIGYGKEYQIKNGVNHRV